MNKLLLTAISFTILSACTPTTATRGNYLYAEDISMIQPTISTQYDVLNTLGTPTAKAMFDETTWYYVGLKTTKESFFDEKVKEHQVYKVVFDELGTVSLISQVDNESVDVPLTSRVTPTSGNEVTFLQQLLGNLGKFNPPSE